MLRVERLLLEDGEAERYSWGLSGKNIGELGEELESMGYPVKYHYTLGESGHQELLSSADGIEATFLPKRVLLRRDPGEELSPEERKFCYVAEGHYNHDVTLGRLLMIIGLGILVTLLAPYNPGPAMA